MATLSNQGPSVAAWVWQYLICQSENTHTLRGRGKAVLLCCAVYPCFCWLFSNTCAQQPRQQTQRISAQAAGIFLSFFFFLIIERPDRCGKHGYSLYLTCIVTQAQTSPWHWQNVWFMFFFISSPKVSCQSFDLADALGGNDDKPGQYNTQEVCIRESNQPFSVLKSDL